MNPLVLNHLCYRIRNAAIRQWPFPHFYIEEIWPERFYKELLASLPAAEGYHSGSANYNGRKFAEIELEGLKSDDFLRANVCAFEPWFRKRFPEGKFTPDQDLRLVLDSQNYSIGPHTDAPWKILSLLFYLPEDYALERLGTSIYLPKDRDFRCPGGPHHKFDLFERVYTAPFRPNSLFGFFKTDFSFHGVEPITIACRRDVLLWNLYDAALRPH